jgi:hypothetical protein
VRCLACVLDASRNFAFSEVKKIIQEAEEIGNETAVENTLSESSGSWTAFCGHKTKYPERRRIL